MVAAALQELAQRPMRTARAADLADAYAEPRHELKRLAKLGVVTRLAHGVYTLTPLGARPGWIPELEVAAMAWATAIYGDRVPILTGLGAARFHHAIPRALGVTVVSLPVQHRSIDIAGGRAVFMTRDVNAVRARTETSELGDMLVTTPEQTLLDLISRPALGGLPDETYAAAQHLAERVDLDLVHGLAAQQRRTGRLAAFLRNR